MWFGVCPQRWEAGGLFFPAPSANIYLTLTVGQVLPECLIFSSLVQDLSWFLRTTARALLIPTTLFLFRPPAKRWGVNKATIRTSRVHQSSLYCEADNISFPFCSPSHRGLEIGSISGRKHRWSLHSFSIVARWESKEHEELEIILHFQTSPSELGASQSTRSALSPQLVNSSSFPIS